MRGVVVLAVFASSALFGWAQEEPPYKPGENPYQDEFVFKLGEPIALYVEIEGTRFAELTITPQGNVEPGKNVKCQVVMTGARVASGRVEVLPVLLLEDQNGKRVDRLTPAPFKVRGERRFEYKDTITASGDSLAAAAKVWLYLEVR